MDPLLPPTTAAAAVANALVVQQALSIVSTLNLYAYLNPYDGYVKSNSRFDYIVVGGGTSGCVVARRLAEDRTKTVLLIEAGGNFDIESSIPSLLPYSLSPRITWDFTAEPDNIYRKCHRDSRYKPAQGKVLGGTSSIDYLIASQGYCSNYESWAKLTNESSWSCRNVIRLFKKVESYNDPRIKNSPDSKYHGFNGQIGLTKDDSPVINKYLEAFRRAGRNIVNDINVSTKEGVSGAVYYTLKGLVQNSCQNYTTPIRNYPNIVVLKKTTVIRILFDRYKRAIGVLANCRDNKLRTFFVDREVIVCAGVFNTPKLLQLSGIGTRELLNYFNIPIVSVLPVGLNYFNHLATIIYATTVKTHRTFVPENFNPGKTNLEAIIARTPKYRAVIYIEPLTPPTVGLTFASYDYRFNDDICDYWYQNGIGKEGLITLLEDNDPKSRGQVRIRSLDPLEPPIIDTQYYSKKVDVDNMIKYVKDWVATLRRIGADFVDPTPCGSFIIGSDDYWKCYVQCLVTYLTHHGGTAALGSVVDGRGRVLGVTGLRVADTSIMPKPILGSTTMPCMMIGENMAEMIIQDNCG